MTATWGGPEHITPPPDDGWDETYDRCTRECPIGVELARETQDVRRLRGALMNIVDAYEVGDVVVGIRLLNAIAEAAVLLHRNVTTTAVVCSADDVLNPPF